MVFYIFNMEHHYITILKWLNNGQKQLPRGVIRKACPENLKIWKIELTL